MTTVGDLIDVPDFGPMEDLLLGLVKPLTRVMPELRVKTLIEPAYSFNDPTVLLRRKPGSGASESFSKAGSYRFIRRAIIKVETFTRDGDVYDADVRGDRLQELVFRRLLTARRRNIVVPDVGYLSDLKASSPAHRVSDWATSTGIVQYANLPKGMVRYEATYTVGLRPIRGGNVDPLKYFA